MYAVILVIHVLVSIILISVILLQAGHGGGIADAFGGGSTSSALGTQSATVLNRATAVCGAIFILTSLVLTILSGHRSRSLMEKAAIQQAVESRLAGGEATEVEEVVAGETEPVTVTTTAVDETGAVTTDMVPVSAEESAQLIQQVVDAVEDGSKMADAVSAATSEAAERAPTAVPVVQEAAEAVDVEKIPMH